ncbi:MAG TPA: signal peptidase II [Candidatus Eisenbacteria bacterium]|jgi:lipoprotein signal peptidase|nr:signal peptidase II [Candidatus Eisenbacteria bacterium]
MLAHGELRAAETEFRKQTITSEKKQERLERERPWLWYAAAVLFFVIDRFLKEVAVIRGVDDSPGMVSFSLFRNHGIAFSLPLRTDLYWPAALIIFVLLAVFFVRALKRDKVRAGILFMIILGAISNLLDRYLYAATTDYLIFFGWSAVNLADGMIVVGLIALYFHGAKKERAA